MSACLFSGPGVSPQRQRRTLFVFAPAWPARLVSPSVGPALTVWFFQACWSHGVPNSSPHCTQAWAHGRESTGVAVGNGRETLQVIPLLETSREISIP